MGLIFREQALHIHQALHAFFGVNLLPDDLGHAALLRQTEAAAEVAVQVGFGAGGQPRQMLRSKTGVAQVLDGGGGQAVEAAPVFVALGLGKLGQKVAQQLAAGLLAAGDVVVQAVAWCRSGPGTGAVGGRHGHGEACAAHHLAVERDVEQLVALADAGHQRHDGCCQVSGQRAGQQQGQAGFVCWGAACEGGGQGVWPHHMQAGGGPKQAASGLQVGAHGFAPTGQRQHQLPALPLLRTTALGTPLGGQQGHAQRQFADGGAFGLGGQLVGALRGPDAQRHGKPEHEPPLVQLLQAVLRLAALGGTHPQLGGWAQAMLRTQGIQLHPLRVMGIQIDHARSQPAQHFRNDGPACPQRTQQDVGRSGGGGGSGGDGSGVCGVGRRGKGLRNHAEMGLCADARPSR